MAPEPSSRGQRPARGQPSAAPQTPPSRTTVSGRTTPAGRTTPPAAQPPSAPLLPAAEILPSAPAGSKTKEKPDRNPMSKAEWKQDAERQFLKVDVEALLLSNLSNDISASKLAYKDFLCLNVLWDTHKATNFHIKDYVDGASIQMARASLDGKQCCNTFYENMSKGAKEAKEYPEDSIFALVGLYMDLVFRLDQSTATESPKVLLSPRVTRSMQRHATSAPETPGDVEMMDVSDMMQQSDEDEWMSSEPATASSSRSGPEGWSPGHASEFTPTEDEVVVNMALVLLLNALTERKDGMRSKGYRWLPNRDVFKILLPPPTSASPSSTKVVKPQKLLEARTDGCLRHTPSNLSAAILEVKPGIRAKDVVTIQWQEGAQMAAQIYSFLCRETPPKPGFGLLACDKPGVKRRLLCSQDNGEIYITIAEYDDEYEMYLRRHHPGSKDRGVGRSFMHMRSYGPWRVNERRDLKHVCEILLALSLYLAK